MRISLAAAHLLGLEVLIQEVQSRLVGLSTAHDGEHALSSLIMRSLGNADASTRCLADLTDLATSSANDASNHVRRNADVLRLELLAILVMSGWSTLGSIGVGTAVIVLSGGTLAEIGAVACTHDAVVLSVIATLIADSLTDATTSLSSNNRIVQHCSSASLPVINQTLANLPNSLLDSFWSSLNFDDALGGLREHLLLGNHANTGDILDMLDLETLSANDGTHLVVRDQQLDSYCQLAKNSIYA